MLRSCRKIIEAELDSVDLNEQVVDVDERVVDVDERVVDVDERVVDVDEHVVDVDEQVVDVDEAGFLFCSWKKAYNIFTFLLSVKICTS